MVKALVCRFLDKNNNEVPEGGGYLGRIAKIASLISGGNLIAL
jgi:glycerate kinase